MDALIESQPFKTKNDLIYEMGRKLFFLIIPSLAGYKSFWVYARKKNNIKTVQEKPFRENRR